ncbi:hypothetical protein FRC15_006445 [Serendipita sp. 397]|nr:hypothetical protein FRC15_006445 [Serendipita sp. 397]
MFKQLLLLTASTLVGTVLVLGAPAPDANSAFAASRGGRGFPLAGLGIAAISPMIPFINCPLNDATLSLPADQTTIAVTPGAKPVAVALGVGTQNYTCTAAGNYTSAGAVATLFDLSCLVNDPLGHFATIQEDLFKLPAPARNAIVALASKTPLNIGAHYFVTNPVTGTGISPKFAQAANGGALFTVLGKKGGIKAPTGNGANVDWLQLAALQGFGSWAQTVFRVDTKLGQPPASCTSAQVNTTITVPYAAKYWFFP